MSIAIGSDSLFNLNTTNASKTSELEKKLEGKLDQSTDKELMDVCKNFESYLLEQVFKKMDSTIQRSEEEGSEYVDYFRDNMFQEYAKDATDQQGMGIAQMLYESMKRNQ